MTHICKICGTVEEPTRWIPKMEKQLKERTLCFGCNHWETQRLLDQTERGEHQWAVINGVHYVFLPHTGLEWPRGMGGVNHKIQFNDGTIVECDNVWCQGNIPEGYWRNIFPDNAKFI